MTNKLKKTKAQRIKEEIEAQDREWSENRARVLMLIANGEPLKGTDKVIAYQISTESLRPTNHA